MAIEGDICEVYVAESSMEAHAVRNVLDSEGVHAQVVGDVLESVHGGIPLGAATSPRIVVGQCDMIRAREVISLWKQVQLDRARESTTLPFQYGMRILLVNLTLLAVVFSLYPLLGGALFTSLLWPTVFWFVLGNLMYIAYHRKYSDRLESTRSDPLKHRHMRPN